MEVLANFSPTCAFDCALSRGLSEIFVLRGAASLRRKFKTAIFPMKMGYGVSVLGDQPVRMSYVTRRHVNFHVSYVNAGRAYGKR